MKNFKILLFAAVLVLPAAGCGQKTTPQQSIQQASSTGQVIQPGAPSANLQVATTTGEPAPGPSGMTQTIQNAGGSDYFPGGKGPGSQGSPAAKLTVSQSVEGSNLNQPSYQVTDGQTAFDLLNSTHKVTAKDYGSMGQFVQSIDGITPDSQHFWELFVNGKSSNVGASSYTLKNGDQIQWKLAAISGNGE